VDIIFVTSNEGKFKTAKEVLSKYNINVIRKGFDFDERRSKDISEIAKNKALQAFKKIKKSLMVEDSGLFIPSLGGFPGTFTNFVLNTIGVEGLLKLLEGKVNKCFFNLALVYCGPNGEIKVFTYKDHGRLTDKKFEESKENSWSKLFSVYVPEGYNKPLNEMNKEEYKKFKKEWYKRIHFKELAEWLLKAER